jgi:hypothetical protein
MEGAHVTDVAMARALATTHSAFYVPLILSALVISGVRDAGRHIPRLVAGIVPAITDAVTWADWAEALAAAAGWLADPDAATDFFRHVHVPGLAMAPYAPAVQQEALVDRLFAQNAPVAVAVTAAAARFAAW